MIRIICVGKIKESFFRDAIDEYLKRLSKYTKMEIIEIPDCGYDSDRNIELESKNIISKIKSKDYNILMDIKG